MIGRVRREWAAILPALVATLAWSCAGGGDQSYLQEGQTFAEEAVRAISARWEPEQLLKRADPMFLKVMPEAKARDLVATCRSELGPLMRLKTELATVGLSGLWPRRKAEYRIHIECERGSANLVATVRKTDHEWRILGFYVDIQN